MENNQDDGKPYYVVRFIEIPFEGIDDYVCVPQSWIVIRRATSSNKVAVSYPNDEDPIDTRDRVKRKERYNDDWKLYMAEVRYETETYRDAEYWIASRNDYRPWFEKDPRRKAAQPEPTSDSKLPSGSRNHPSKSTRDKPQLTPKIIEILQKLPAKTSWKRAAQSEAVEQPDEERRRQNAVRPSGSAGTYINMPGCSKRERSIVIGERDKTEAAVASSSDKSAPSQLTGGNLHRSSPMRQAENGKLGSCSLPIIDADGPTEVISIGEEGHLQGERQPSETNSNSQSQHNSNTTSASVAPPQPPTSVEQPFHSDHIAHRQDSQDRENLHSNFQPIITDIRSIRETDNEQTPRTDGIPSNEPYASHHLPSSLKMSARLYSKINVRPSLIPMHEPLEMRIRLANSERLMAIAAQNPLNLLNQNSLSPPEKQEPMITQNPSQNINTTHFQIKIAKSNGITALDPKVVLENINNVASAIQHTPSLPHQRPSFVRRIIKRRNSPDALADAYADVPDAFQRPSGSHSIAERTSLEEVSMQEASTVQRLPNPAANQPNAGAPLSYQNNPVNFHQEQRQELRRTPTEGINPAQTTHSGTNISIPTCHLILTNIAHQTISSLDSPQRRQPPQCHRDTQQRPRPSEPQVGSLTNASNDGRLPIVQGVTQRSPPYVEPSIPDSTGQTITKSFRDHLLHLQQLGLRVSSQKVIPAGNIVNTSAVRSPPRSADHVRQTDKLMEVDPLPPDQGSSSDPEVVVDPGVITKQEMFTNNADGAGTSGAQGYAIANNQLHTRIVLEQQMLDHFSTILTQIGSNIYYSCEMYKNLRGSILETADTYKKLMEVAERFNALGDAESAASFSSNGTTRILPFNEERQTRATKRANSSNHNQHSSRVDEEPPNRKRKMRSKIVLPAEYDRNDTGWTLKYRKMVPELKELLPGRGIYVNSTKLMCAERVSGDCRTLASLVLEEVFSKTALIICSTWHETKSPKKCWIERPPLDPAAWDALVSYVIWCGSIEDWNTDTGEIIKAMDNKIYQMRVKADVFPEPYSP